MLSVSVVINHFSFFLISKYKNLKIDMVEKHINQSDNRKKKEL